MRVLIVDDHAGMLELMGTHFEQAGAVIKKIGKPAEALALAKAAMDLGEPFAMIVVDIMMPEMTGFELAGKLREAGYEGPIVAFTATTSGLGKKDGEAVGIATYLSKETLSTDLVKALLNEHIGKTWSPKEG